MRPARPGRSADVQGGIVRRREQSRWLSAGHFQVGADGLGNLARGLRAGADDHQAQHPAPLPFRLQLERLIGGRVLGKGEVGQGAVVVQEFRASRPVRCNRSE